MMVPVLWVALTNGKSSFGAFKEVDIAMQLVRTSQE